MGTKERIFHMVLFEIIGLILLTLFAMLLTDGGLLTLGALAITLSLIAMIWNYIYNIWFDRWFGYDRSQRTLRTRLLHGGGFELGMIVFSFPVIMWTLKMDFWTVLWMDLGAVVFFLIYAIVFNWAYDQIRVKYFGRVPDRPV